jgi:hypothetical protein
MLRKAPRLWESKNTQGARRSLPRSRHGRVPVTRRWRCLAKIPFQLKCMRVTRKTGGTSRSHGHVRHSRRIHQTTFCFRGNNEQRQRRLPAKVMYVKRAHFYSYTGIVNGTTSVKFKEPREPRGPRGPRRPPQGLPPQGRPTQGRDQQGRGRSQGFALRGYGSVRRVPHLLVHPSTRSCPTIHRNRSEQRSLRNH